MTHAFEGTRSPLLLAQKFLKLSSSASPAGLASPGMGMALRWPAPRILWGCGRGRGRAAGGLLNTATCEARARVAVGADSVAAPPTSWRSLPTISLSDAA